LKYFVINKIKSLLEKHAKLATDNQEIKIIRSAYYVKLEQLLLKIELIYAIVVSF
jgi:hypothetical protein